MTEANELDHLPILVLTWPCLQCGAYDEGQACNIDAECRVTDCARCAERKN